MYCHEKVIEGFLHYKTTPKGKWKRVGEKELTRRLVAAEKRIKKLEDYLDNTE